MTDGEREFTPPGSNGIKTQLFYIERNLDQLTKTVVTKDQLKLIEVELGDLKDTVEKKTASKLTEKIVYGMVGFIMLSFLAALVAIALRSP